MRCVRIEAARTVVRHIVALPRMDPVEISSVIVHPVTPSVTVAVVAAAVAIVTILVLLVASVSRSVILAVRGSEALLGHIAVGADGAVG